MRAWLCLLALTALGCSERLTIDARSIQEQAIAFLLLEEGDSWIPKGPLLFDENGQLVGSNGSKAKTASFLR